MKAYPATRLLALSISLAITFWGGERAASAAAPIADAVALDKNLAGEACQSRRRAELGAGRVEQAVDIACGPGNSVVGALAVAVLPAAITADGPGRHEACLLYTSPSPRD